MQQKFWIWYVIFLAVAIPAVLFVPRLERLALPDASGPGAITILTLGIIFALFTTLILFGFYKEKNLTKGFIVSALTYSGLVILVRFALSPLSFYAKNGQEAFSTSFVNPFSFFIVSLVAFLLYFTVLLAMYLYFRWKTRRALSEAPRKKNWTVRALILLVLALIVGVAIMAGAVPILFGVPLFGVIFFGTYAAYVFSSIWGICITACLVVAIFFLRQAFKEVSEQAIKIRDVGLVTAFFWVGASILFIYSALWFVYLLIIVAVWPLRTFVPGK